MNLSKGCGRFGLHHGGKFEFRFVFPLGEASGKGVGEPDATAFGGCGIFGDNNRG